MIKIAIVGCGWVAGTQIETGFALLPDLFEIVACCDVDEARMESFAAKYGIAIRCRDYRDVLALDDLDAVSICTPPSEHHAMVRQAMAAGKHVLCEKPFTSSLALMDDVIDAQTRSSARIMPIFQYRYGPGFAKAKALVDSGFGGKLYTSSVETAWLRGPAYYGVPWRGKFATELGGVLLTQSIHIHDLFMTLAGPASDVVAFKTTRVNPIEVEDCAVVGLRMADGSLATLTATLGSAEPLTRFRLCFENLVIERECRGLEAPKPALEPWRFVAKIPERQAEVDAIVARVPDGALFFEGQFRAFHAAIKSGAPFDIQLSDARRSLELITAIFAAADTGVAQRLPIEGRHARYRGWHESGGAG